MWADAQIALQRCADSDNGLCRTYLGVGLIATGAPIHPAGGPHV